MDFQAVLIWVGERSNATGILHTKYPKGMGSKVHASEVVLRNEKRLQEADRGGRMLTYDRGGSRLDARGDEMTRNHAKRPDLPTFPKDRRYSCQQQNLVALFVPTPPSFDHTVSSLLVRRTDGFREG